MKRYSQMGTAMIPGCTSLDGKPAGQWVEWKDVEVLLAELNLLRSSVPTEARDIIERCAVVCDKYADEQHRAYKIGHGPKRGDSYTEGESDGASECAAQIRALASAMSPQREKT